MWQYETTELYHYGVPGMRWRHRKARPVTTGTGRRRGQQVQSASKSNNQDAQAKKKARLKKGLIIGGAVVGTALAAYGTYKLTKYCKDKNTAKRIKLGEEMMKIRQQQYKADSETFRNMVANNRRNSIHGSVYYKGFYDSW